MTMNDLEHDLKNLAEPQEADERLRLAVRAELVEQLQLRPIRRRRMRLALTSAALATAAIVVAILALVGTGGSGGPAPADAAIIHLAIKAVSSPANEILHVRVDGVQNGTAIVGEWWQQTSPPYASRGIKGEVGHQGESSDDGHTTFEYDPSTNTIYERPDASPPTFTDPISQIREELRNGDAQVEGVVVIGGASLYKIDLPNGLVGYFDRNTYLPRYLDDPQRDGSDVVRLHVTTYEYLPLTQSNRALLSVTAQHPGARIDTNPGDAPGGGK